MKNIKKIFFFILILAAGISLIFLNSGNKLDFLKNFNFKAINAIEPPFLYIGERLSFVKLFFNGINNLKEENKNLKEENINFQSQLLEFEKIKSENLILRDILDIKNKRKLNLVPAEVVLKASQAVGDYFIINKGEKDGLEIGQPVIISEIIVGKILEVYDDYSKVLMLNNPMLKLSAVIQADGDSIKGLVEGGLNWGANMKLIEKGKKISVGGIVMTSGIDEKIPSGFLIGRIERVRNLESSVFQEVFIKLPMGLEQINEVFIINN